MPAAASTSGRTGRSSLAVGLAFVAGSADAAGYVLLGNIFTANMTGNTVLLGIHLARADWDAALRSAVPVPLFVLGAFLAAMFLAQAGRRPLPRVLALMGEAVLLGAFWVIGGQFAGRQGGSQDPAGGGWLHYALVACLSVAMGLQSASLRHVAGEMARTTPVSGALLGSADALARSLHQRRKPEKKAGEAKEAQKHPHPVVLAAMWGSYLLGALAAALCVGSLGFGTVALALGLLGGLITLELLRVTRGAHST